MVAFAMGVLKTCSGPSRIWLWCSGFFRSGAVLLRPLLVMLLFGSDLWGGGGCAAGAGASDPGLGSASKPIVLVAYGDSLTAGFRLPADAAFPAQLEAALRARGQDVRVVNGGVSGDTAADGLARLDWTVPDDADAVLVELGANDALRGLPPGQTKKTLGAILARLKERRLVVLLAGMRAPRNWGPEYAEAFAALFPALAKEYNVQLYPFFLDGVAFQTGLNQADGLHPTREGVSEIVRRIMPSVEQLIEEAKAVRAKAGR
jgi:acyl-CoA thioesterase-1